MEVKHVKMNKNTGHSNTGFVNDSVIELHKGDMIILTLPEDTTRKDAECIYKDFKKAVESNVPIGVLYGGAKLQVLRRCKEVKYIDNVK